MNSLIVRLVYSLEKIHSFVHVWYIAQEELMTEFQGILAKDLRYVQIGSKSFPLALPIQGVEHLMYVVSENGVLTAYHANEYCVRDTEIDVYTDFVLDRFKSYLGFLDSNQKFVPVQEFPLDSHTCGTQLYDSHLYNPESCTVITIRHTEGTLNQVLPLSSFNDAIFIHRTRGVILVNSSAYVFLIASLFRTSQSYDHLSIILDCLFDQRYFVHLRSAFYNLFFDIEVTQYSNPIPEYDKIYSLFNLHDPMYSTSGHKRLQTEIVDFFSGFNSSDDKAKVCFIDLMYGVKRDLCLELHNVYHRLRNFPHERRAIYKQFGNHPYVKLIKHLHQKLITEKSVSAITPDAVWAYFTISPTTDTFVCHDELMLLIMAASKHRHQLFVSMYELFLATTRAQIKPKYKYSGKKYFPFKIFSSKLFLFGHLLNI